MPTESAGAAHLLEAEREVRLLRRVFERFVARFLDRHLSPRGWRVEAQKYIDWPIEAASPQIADLLPRHCQLDGLWPERCGWAKLMG
jgi:hypothetical protein